MQAATREQQQQQVGPPSPGLYRQEYIRSINQLIISSPSHSIIIFLLKSEIVFLHSALSYLSGLSPVL